MISSTARRTKIGPLASVPLAVAISLLSACQASTPHRDPSIPDGLPPPEMGRSVEAKATTMITIQGKATYVQKIGLPEGSTLRVQLVNTRLADTPAAVVADKTFPVTHGSPIPFALAVDPAKLDARMSYSLSASVRTPDGGLVFVTETATPVDTKSTAPVTLMLKMARP